MKGLVVGCLGVIVRGVVAGTRDGEARGQGVHSVLSTLLSRTTTQKKRDTKAAAVPAASERLAPAAQAVE